MPRKTNTIKVEARYRIKEEANPQALPNNYMLQPPSLQAQKIPKIKIEPGVGLVDSFESRFVVSQLEGRMNITKRIKLSPCYPITPSSVLMLPAIVKQVASKLKKDFECTYCYRRYERKASLNRHLRIHKRKYRHQCIYCPKVFQEKAQLLKHYRTHSADKPFRCIICNTGFNQKGHLRRHFRIHSGYRPFKCTQCTKAFTRATCLVGHVRTHTGERPWRCVQCPKAFTQSYNLRRHVRSHNVDRPYYCVYCHKRFSKKDVLSRHLESHNSSSQMAVKIEPIHNLLKVEVTLPDYLKLENTRLRNSEMPAVLNIESTESRNLKPGGILSTEETRNIVKFEEDNKYNGRYDLLKKEPIRCEQIVG
jgi:hypothetical protein